MKPAELIKIGVPHGEEIKTAVRAIVAAVQSGIYNKDDLHTVMKNVVADPQQFVEDAVFGEIASMLVKKGKADILLDKPIPFEIFGRDIENGPLDQMRTACRLPVAVAGALMPDAHAGYGLPIGGVLATESVVIPYAVGVDIACRMKMSVLDLPLSALDDQKSLLIAALRKETAFGRGARFKKKRNHAVLDEDWGFSKIASKAKDTAWAQLGTSGGGELLCGVWPARYQRPAPRPRTRNIPSASEP